MRSLGLLTALLALGTATSAFAQPAEDQAAPTAAAAPFSAATSPQHSPASRSEWPASAKLAKRTSRPTAIEPAPVYQAETTSAATAATLAPAAAPVPADSMANPQKWVLTPSQGGYVATPVNSPAQMPVETIESEGSGAIPALPLEMMTSNGITYVNGGIGDEEKAAIKSMDKDFNVHVLLTAPQGQYISDVMLRILDAKGEQRLVSVADAGPYFYAKMAPGTYTLETISSRGVPKRSLFTVTDKNTVRQHVTYAEQE